MTLKLESYHAANNKWRVSLHYDDSQFSINVISMRDFAKR